MDQAPKTFLEAVNQGLDARFTPMGKMRPLTHDIAGNPIKKTPSADDDLNELESMTRKLFGPAGDAGLSMFSEGKGVRFGIDPEGTPMVELLAEGDGRLIIDGTEMPDHERLRSFLQKKKASK